MTGIFFSHQFKHFWRAKNSGKNLAIQIVMGILVLYLLLNVLLIAVYLDKLLPMVFKTMPLYQAFCSIVLYYFVIDLLLRFHLQELPTMHVQPYLHMRIPKNSIIRHLSFTSLQSVFNLWPLLLFSPFILKYVPGQQGWLTAVWFLVAIAGFTVFNNYLNQYIMRRAHLNGWFSAGFTALLGLLIKADYSWNLLSFSKLSITFFTSLQTKPWLVLLPLALAVAIYTINFYYLKYNLYLEELSPPKTSYKTGTHLPAFARFNQMLVLATNEFKLIWRNKRPRAALITTLFILFYGLLFYTQPKMYGDAYKVFCGMFMSGIFIINYGQFMYGWQGGHFDGLLAAKVNFREFLRAKYLLFTAVSTAAFILSIPYAYFGWWIIGVHFVMWLWNIGVNATIVLFFANHNYKRVDLTRGASFNVQGLGATQFLLSLPLLVLPYLVYWPMSYFGLDREAFGVLGIIALAFIMARGWFITRLDAAFHKNKYKIAQGFRSI